MSLFPATNSGNPHSDQLIYIYIYILIKGAGLRALRGISRSPWLPRLGIWLGIRPSFRMLTWELKNILLVSESTEKRLPSKPQCDPKVIQMALGGPFKTRGIYGVGATSGLFWRPCEVISFLLLFQAPTRSGFW